MAENDWKLNDSYPIFMGMEFAPEPVPWDDWWWGGPMSMVMPLDEEETLPGHRIIQMNAFFGPR